LNEDEHKRSESARFVLFCFVLFCFVFLKEKRWRCRPAHDFAGHGGEGLLDVGGVLGRGLEEGDAEAVSKVLGGVVVDDLLGGQVALVSDEELVDVFAGVAVDLLEPLLDVGEGGLVGDVVDDDDAVRSTVVTGRDGTEALLSGGIPNLQLDGLAVELNGADLKVHSNGADVALCVGVVRKAQQETALTDSRVTNQKELEEKVVLGVHFFSVAAVVVVVCGCGGVVWEVDFCVCVGFVSFLLLVF
jgi:hypothetical protein